MNIRWIVFFAIVALAACAGPKTVAGSSAISGRVDLKTVLSWLPPDTETLQVANGPFLMSNFVIGGPEDKDHEITSGELEKQFEGLTLSLFNSGRGILEKHLDGKKVLFAIEGSRHFRPPTGLGELPFEGCAVAVFQDDLEDRRDVFMKDAGGVAVAIEDIEGQRVAEFEEQEEQDRWTLFITFPEKNVVWVSTNRKFLQEMLVRKRTTQRQIALPDSLPEWMYVDKTAKFWGLRHYDKLQSNYDPTSPFGGKKSANFPDEGAVGLTYQCNPRTERRATLVYVTGAGAESRKIAEDRFPDAGEPEQMAGLHIQHHEVAPGVIQSTFDLSHSEPTDLFFFIFMDHLGHAVYL
jgi:hypothetical protein